MAKKEFTFRGKTLDELKQLSLKEFAQLIKSSQRRKILRGFTDQEKILMKKIREKQKNIKTHSKEIIILPEMVGSIIKVHTGNSFSEVRIQEEMLGRCLGEFVSTRKRVQHSAPGIGATRSSAAMSVK